MKVKEEDRRRKEGNLYTSQKYCRGNIAGPQGKGGCCVLRSTVYDQSPSLFFSAVETRLKGQTDGCSLPLSRTVILLLKPD